MLRIVLAGLAATTIEWYDFYIFGTAAALVFPALFFPEASETAGTLLAFSTFGVAFVARPVGGALFGHLGDRVGRKKTLVATLVTMGVASALIGLLPTYGAIGVLAPVLLAVLRFAQGLAVGGQWGGAMLLITESAPETRRGFYGSFAQVGLIAGSVASTTSFLVLAATLSDTAFETWGWRVPFLLSVLLIGIALYVALRLEETVAFERVKEAGTEARLPIVDVLRAYPRQVILAAGAMIGITGSSYVIVTYMISYGTQELGVSRSVILTGIVLSSLLTLPCLLLFAGLSDRVGRRGIFMAGALLAGLWSFPTFWLVDTRTTVLIWLGLAVYQVFFAMMFGPQAALFAEMFGTRVRYSGASLGYQVGTMLGGGLAPTIAAALFAATGASAAVATYMAATCLISLVSVYLATETYQTNLEEVGAAQRQPGVKTEDLMQGPERG